MRRGHRSGCYRLFHAPRRRSHPNLVHFDRVWAIIKPNLVDFDRVWGYIPLGRTLILFVRGRGGRAGPWPAPPASAPAMAYADAALKAQAQRAIDAAATDGLYLPVDQGMTGFRGVILNANKGQGRPPRKMPYRARLTEVAKPCKRILGSWFGTAEEAALDRAKMLKSHPGKYKDP